MINDYGDIINLPHHVSRNHAQMSMQERAAQFSPFAALSGHDAAIHAVEKARSAKAELDEYVQDKISAKLVELMNEKPSCDVKIKYFVQDEDTTEGVYVTRVGAIKKFDPARKLLILSDGSRIELDNIFSVYKAGPGQDACI